MKQTADAVIIGGGVMGCSILYHLAKLGVTDSLLLEQDVLGSGSTGRSQTICRTHYLARWYRILQLTTPRRRSDR